MIIGQLISTSLGDLTLLDIQKDYLILFNPEQGQFIKANGYKENDMGKVYWQGGEYYNKLTDLVAVLEID